MPKFEFSIRHLKTVARICSGDETRYALCGVHVVLAPGKPVVLEATDGRKLVRFTSDWSHDAEAQTDFIIDVRQIKEAPAERNGVPDTIEYNGNFPNLCPNPLIQPAPYRGASAPLAPRR